MNLSDLIIKGGTYVAGQAAPVQLLTAAGLNELRDELIELRRLRAITYEEWQVTGHPGGEFPPYVFTWSPVRGEDDPERAARGFIELIKSCETWADGPHLHRRTVTMTDWEEA